MKLTKAQRELLANLPSSCAEYYPPAKRLIALGLAKWRPGYFDDVLVITPAGRLALEAQND